MAEQKKNKSSTKSGRLREPVAQPMQSAKALPAPAPAPKHGLGAVPIVGIGASAGGLEALEQFFVNVPPDCGMAFVVVQHLDPTHKGIMIELLQRKTAMTVMQATNRTRVKPNHVYVIPPNKDMSLLHDCLYLFPPAQPRGLRLPIDFFFRSLADDRREASIGVVLSGMGSDGTLGLGAIKEKAGLALVQTPASAKFDGMPRSAIDAGAADIVAPAGELAARIIAFVQRVSRLAPGEADLGQRARGALDRILILIRAHTGHDFSLYRKSTIYRRIERRMSVHQIDNIASYVRFLRENPQESELLFHELLIGVTSFFRDPDAWDYLKSKALPALLKDKRSGRALRAWVPGCSTGEEAYSLAIVFKEALESVKSAGKITLNIFATDLDQGAIEKARAGFYLKSIASGVSPQRLKRFFVGEDGGYRVSNDIREMVVFAAQNLIMDPPFTKLDILSCRNLLIYLTPELQKTVVPLLHYSLKPGGILFLGSAESVSGFHDLFAPLLLKERIYKRIDSGARPMTVDFPTKAWPATSRLREDAEMAAAPAVDVQSQADRLLLRRFTPAAVIVNKKGDIIHVNGHTGKYLEPASGRANWNIYAMAREGLRDSLLAAFHKAVRQQGNASAKNLTVATEAGEQTVDVTVESIAEPESLRGMVIIAFQDVVKPAPPPRAGRAPARTPRFEELERETRRQRDELRTTREEMQSSQEELKSAYEELQSANEELQSTNEELMTSKEEMQSLNEELQTVNAELQSNVDELSRASSDMKNLLDSTDIATLFLDGDLHVRRFTLPTTRIIKLIASDVGRPLSDIASDLRYAEMQDDAREVLRTLAYSEKQVPCDDGRWYRVRIMPYRTLDNRIDGLVITFTDISETKKLEAELRGAVRASPRAAQA